MKTPLVHQISERIPSFSSSPVYVKHHEKMHISMANAIENTSKRFFESLELHIRSAPNLSLTDVSHLSPANSKLKSFFAEKEFRDIDSTLQLCCKSFSDSFAPLVYLAGDYDRKLFAPFVMPYDKKEDERMRISMMVSPLDDIAHMCRVSPIVLASKIKNALKNGMDFLHFLVRVDDPLFIFSIEQVLHLNYKMMHSIILPDILYSQKHMIAEMLCKLDCCQTFISERVGLSSTVIKGLDPQKFSVKAPRLSKYNYEKVMNDPFQNLLVMTMIAFYTMGCRVLCRQNPFNSLFSRVGVPDKVSIPMAIGAYSSTKNMFRHEPLRSLFFKKGRSIMPEFTEFMQILELYLAKKANIIACSKCHTPTLQFDESVVNIRTLKKTAAICHKCSHTDTYYPAI